MLTYVREYTLKPGDIIHCKTAEEAGTLRLYLIKEGYVECASDIRGLANTPDIWYMVGNGSFWRWYRDSYQQPEVYNQGMGYTNLPGAYSQVPGCQIIEYSAFCIPENLPGAVSGEAPAEGNMKGGNKQCRNYNMIS